MEALLAWLNLYVKWFFFFTAMPLDINSSVDRNLLLA